MALVAGVGHRAVRAALPGTPALPVLDREARFRAEATGGSGFGAYVLGLAFAFGWTPCIGPVLGAILSLAAQEGSVERGLLLMAVYALGLGLPSC